jgi:hypothetical protein
MDDNLIEFPAKDTTSVETLTPTKSRDLIEFGITSTTFLMMDWMRSIGCSDKEIEQGAREVSKHWTETIPSLFGATNFQTKLGNEIEDLIVSMNDDESIFTKKENE